MKYLGVKIDWRLQWEEHLKYLEEKTWKILPKILSLCQNTYGYSTLARRTMLYGTIGAYYRYASTCYSSVLHTKENMKRISMLHQKLNVCIGRIYKTASCLGTSTIIGQPPLVLEITARSILISLKKRWTVNWSLFGRPSDGVDQVEHLNRQVILVWQEWWDNCRSGMYVHTYVRSTCVPT